MGLCLARKRGANSSFRRPKSKVPEKESEFGERGKLSDRPLNLFAGAHYYEANSEESSGKGEA